MSKCCVENKCVCGEDRTFVEDIRLVDLYSHVYLVVVLSTSCVSFVIMSVSLAPGIKPCREL